MGVSVGMRVRDLDTGRTGVVVEVESVEADGLALVRWERGFGGRSFVNHNRLVPVVVVGARVEHREWKGYGGVVTAVESLATGEWVRVTWDGSPAPAGWYLAREVDVVAVLWFVSDLQACAVEDLLQAVEEGQAGVTVEVDYSGDSMGMPRVDVFGPSPEVVLAFIRLHWGVEDPGWFESYVVERVTRVGGVS